MDINMHSDVMEMYIERLERTRRRYLIIADYLKEKIFSIEHHSERSKNPLYMPIRDLCIILENFFYDKKVKAEAMIRNAEISYWNTIWRLPEKEKKSKGINY